MAVSVPGSKEQVTPLTATWPPKRTVRSWVASWVMALLGRGQPGNAGADYRTQKSQKSENTQKKPKKSWRIPFASSAHPLRPLRPGVGRWMSGLRPRNSAFVADRNLHLFRLDLVHELRHAPRES